MPYIKKYKIETGRDWKEARKNNNLPKNFPSNPQKVYEDEWDGWGHFLGTGAVSTKKAHEQFMLFHEARSYARTLNFKSEREYKAWAKSSANHGILPSSPNRTYKGEWRGFPDFLGYNNSDKTIRIKGLLKKYTVEQIAKIEGIPKSTVYYHLYKKIDT